MNITNLREILGIEKNDLSPPESAEFVALNSNVQTSPGLRQYRVRRTSMELLDLIKVDFDAATASYFFAFDFIIFILRLKL